MQVAARANLLRKREHHSHAKVTFVELFYDLVFVFAVTQLSHGLLAHLTSLGALQTGLLMFAVWWSWIYTAWLTNWLDPERPAVRALLFVLMLCGLVLSASIPKAFEDRALVFALAYLAMHACRDGFMLWSLHQHDERNYRNFLRISIWHAVAALFWIAGAFADSSSRLALWAIAIAIETAAPMAAFYVPGLGRSATEDWTIEGAHNTRRASALSSGQRPIQTSVRGRIEFSVVPLRGPWCSGAIGRSVTSGLPAAIIRRNDGNAHPRHFLGMEVDWRGGETLEPNDATLASFTSEARPIT